MIYVHGYYGYHNCGDEAFKCVFDKYLGDLDHRYTSPNNPPPRDPAPGDLIILGGGNVIDMYFLESLNNWVGKIYAIGVGVSSSEGLDELARLKPLRCCVRNKSEVEFVKSKIPIAEYIPDLVFSLSGEDLKSSKVGEDLIVAEDLSVKRTDFEKTAVVILSDRILSYLYVDEGFPAGIESIAGLVRLIEFLKYIGLFYNLHFVSFSNDFYHPDDALNKLIASTLSGKRDRISFSSCGSSPAKAFKIIGEADFVLSMKFHSMVFSLVARKPFLNLSDAPKCLSLIGELGLFSFSSPLSLGANADQLKKCLKFVEQSPDLLSADRDLDLMHLLGKEAMLEIIGEIKALIY